MLPTFLVLDFNPGSRDTFASDLLPDTTLRHLKSRRIEVKEEFLLLDGRGGYFKCQVLDPQFKTFRVEARQMQTALTPQIELCVSPPRGDAFAELITQATEIGAHSIRFMRSDHNQYPKSLETPPYERAQRVADAACEQCARAWQLQVHESWHSLKDLLASTDYIHVIADEVPSDTQPTHHKQLSEKIAAAIQPLRLYLGPEGGWSHEERQLFDSNLDHWHRLSLGKLILRVPTAAVAGIYHLRQLSEQHLNR